MLYVALMDSCVLTVVLFCPQSLHSLKGAPIDFPRDIRSCKTYVKIFGSQLIFMIISLFQNCPKVLSKKFK